MASALSRWTLAALCVAATAGNLQAQTPRRSFDDEAAFVGYLQDKGLYSDAVAALDEMNPLALAPAQKDSFRYLKGWSFYNLKQLDSSAWYLTRVTPSSLLFQKSSFFGAYNHIYLGDYRLASQVLDRIGTRGDTAEMVSFEKAGMALLTKDYGAYDSLSRMFTGKLYAFSAQEKNFRGYRDQLSRMGHKSPWVAGLLSAVVPGAGKVYAGKPYQGISSLFPIAALALLTHESYRKRGPRSAEFYAFGSLLTVFYVGNIWGSVFTVKIKKREDEQLVSQKVLLDLQIPLRTIFN